MSSELSEKVRADFENLIAESMFQSHIPGLSIALVKNSKIIFARGYGTRNLEANIPSTPDTLYGIGSITKPFTALAVMQLVQLGKIDLQDPVNTILPVNFKYRDSITIHHLLSHSSGIPDLGLATTVLGRLNRHVETWVPMGDIDDLFLRLNGASDEATEPSKRFFYLNEGYAFLGEIVERVSKMKYEEYIRTRILKPLKMNRSTFLKEEFLKDPDVMTPYIIENKNGSVKTTAATHPFHKLVYALGGLLSSVNELSNFLIANMFNGVFQGTEILNPNLLEEMQKIHIEEPEGVQFYGDFGREGYGYGWMISEDFLGHKLVGHDGDTGVSTAQLLFVPELKIGVVVATNRGYSAYPPVSPTPVLLSALVYLMGKDPTKEIPYFEIEKKFRKLTGEYENYKGIAKLSVIQKGGMLYLKYEDETVPLIPENNQIKNLRFYTIPIPGGKFPVEFEVYPSGEIDLFIERNRFHKITNKCH